MKTFQVSTSIGATAGGGPHRARRKTVHAKLSPGRAFPVKVTEFVPGRKMVWTGGMPFGLFKGERTFTLTERSDGTVEFRMSEAFSGLFSPLIERSIPNLQPAFDEFAAALKSRRRLEGKEDKRGKNNGRH